MSEIKWTPVNERLPDEDYDLVHVTNRYGQIEICEADSILETDLAWRPIYDPEPYIVDRDKPIAWARKPRGDDGR